MYRETPPEKVTERLNLLFWAADQGDSDAMNELIMNYDSLTLPFRLKKEKYYQFISALGESKNSFACFIAIRDKLPIDTPKTPSLISVMEAKKNPAFLTEISNDRITEAFVNLNVAAATGFIPARVKLAGLYHQKHRRNLRNDFKLDPLRDENLNYCCESIS